MDAATRSLVRRSISDARRRLTGAELDSDGMTDMQTSSVNNNSLAVVAWNACDGDPLLALGYALEVLEAKRAAADAA